MAPLNVLLSGCFALIESVQNYLNDKTKVIFRLKIKPLCIPTHISFFFIYFYNLTKFAIISKLIIS